MTLWAILLVPLNYAFATFDFVEGRLHLGKIQINLVFRSICTTFADRKHCSGLPLAFLKGEARGKSGRHRVLHF